MTPPINDIITPTGQRLAIGDTVRVTAGGQRNEIGLVTDIYPWHSFTLVVVKLETGTLFYDDGHRLEHVK